jgi:hypothetical protein
MANDLHVQCYLVAAQLVKSLCPYCLWNMFHVNANATQNLDKLGIKTTATNSNQLCIDLR